MNVTRDLKQDNNVYGTVYTVLNAWFLSACPKTSNALQTNSQHDGFYCMNKS